mgnify:CR=1 FL=1
MFYYPLYRKVDDTEDTKEHLKNLTIMVLQTHKIQIYNLEGVYQWIEQYNIRARWLKG